MASLAPCGRRMEPSPRPPGRKESPPLHRRSTTRVSARPPAQLPITELSLGAREAAAKSASEHLQRADLPNKESPGQGAPEALARPPHWNPVPSTPQPQPPRTTAPPKGHEQRGRPPPLPSPWHSPSATTLPFGLLPMSTPGPSRKIVSSPPETRLPLFSACRSKVGCLLSAARQEENHHPKGSPCGRGRPAVFAAPPPSRPSTPGLRISPDRPQHSLVPAALSLDGMAGPCAAGSMCRVPSPPSRQALQPGTALLPQSWILQGAFWALRRCSIPWQRMPPLRGLKWAGLALPTCSRKRAQAAEAKAVSSSTRSTESSPAPGWDLAAGEDLAPLAASSTRPGWHKGLQAPACLCQGQLLPHCPAERGKGAGGASLLPRPSAEGAADTSVPLERPAGGAVLSGGAPQTGAGAMTKPKRRGWTHPTESAALWAEPHGTWAAASTHRPLCPPAETRCLCLQEGSTHHSPHPPRLRKQTSAAVPAHTKGLCCAASRVPLWPAATHKAGFCVGKQGRGYLGRGPLRL